MTNILLNCLLVMAAASGVFVAIKCVEIILDCIELFQQRRVELSIKLELLRIAQDGLKESLNSCNDDIQEALSDDDADLCTNLLQTHMALKARKAEVDRKISEISLISF